MSFSSTLVDVLDDLAYALGGEFKRRKIKAKSTKRSHYCKSRQDQLSYYPYLVRGLPFSKSELHFIQVVLDTLDELYPKKDDSQQVKVNEVQDAAVRLAVLDTAVARFFAPNLARFRNIERLISYFKRLSFERYEGEQVKTGMIVGRFNFEKSSEAKINGLQYRKVKIESPQRVKYSVLSNVACYRYVDGISAYYLTDPKLNIQGYVSVVNDNLNVFEKIIGGRVELLQNVVDIFLYYIGITSCGDVEIIDGTYNVRLIYRKGRWIFLDTRVLAAGILGKDTYLDDKDDDVWKVFYSLSKIRKGAAALFTRKSLTSLGDFCVGHIAEGKMADVMSKAISKSSVNESVKSGELLRILTTDGMTIFDKRFSKIKDCNVIVDTSVAIKALLKKGGKELGGGGRTTAVIAASEYGTAIKVSEDGPISVYRNGEKIYSVG